MVKGIRYKRNDKRYTKAQARRDWLTIRCEVMARNKKVRAEREAEYRKEFIENRRIELKYNERLRQKQRQTAREWYHKNKDCPKFKESQRRAQRKYYQKNKERLLKDQRKARQKRMKEDPQFVERERARYRKYYWKNREEILKKQREKYKTKTKKEE